MAVRGARRSRGTLKDRGRSSPPVWPERLVCAAVLRDSPIVTPASIDSIASGQSKGTLAIRCAPNPKQVMRASAHRWSVAPAPAGDRRRAGSEAPGSRRPSSVVVSPWSPHHRGSVAVRPLRSRQPSSPQATGAEHTGLAEWGSRRQGLHGPRERELTHRGIWPRSAASSSPMSRPTPLRTRDRAALDGHHTDREATESSPTSSTNLASRRDSSQVNVEVVAQDAAQRELRRWTAMRSWRRKALG